MSVETVGVVAAAAGLATGWVARALWQSWVEFKTAWQRRRYW